MHEGVFTVNNFYVAILFLECGGPDIGSNKAYKCESISSYAIIHKELILNSKDLLFQHVLRH